MKNFSDTIEDLCLIDLPLHGATYTWTRGENIHQASRIDRFLVANDWSDTFRKLTQMVLPNVISDHKPIMLESGDWEVNPSYFKFENM